MKNQNNRQPSSDQGRKKRPTHSASVKRSAGNHRIEDIAGPGQAVDVQRFTQFVVDHMSDAVYWVASGGEVVYVNDATCQRLGYSQAELLSMKITDIVPDYSQSDWANHFRLLKQKNTLVFESRHRMKNGGVFPVEVRTDFVQYENKEYACGIAHDISGRKYMEETLRDSEEKWHSLVVTIPDFVAIYDQNGQYLFLNHIADGFTEKDVIGRDAEDFILPKSRPLFKKKIYAIQKTGEMQRFEHTTLGANGEQREYEEFLVPLKNPRGKTDILSLAYDITKRKRAEEEWLASQARYHTLFENIGMGISQTFPNGRLRYVNSAFAHMYGYDNPEVMIAEVTHVGQQLYVNPGDWEEVLHILQEKGVIEPREVAVRRRDGTLFTVLVGAREIKDVNGNLVCYQAEQIDISER